LRAAIRSGRLPGGTRLPSTRDLAADVKISRGLAVLAYEQLTAEGLLVSRRGAGTMVAGSGAPSLRVETSRTTDPLGTRPIAPLHPGSPDPALFPRAAWRRVYQEALRDLPDGGLGYGDPTGLPELRGELAGYLGRVRAASVDASSLVVTTGASQAIALLATALREAGETAIGVEDPGSEPIRTHLATHGLRAVPIPVDADGLVVDELAAADVRSVIVTPAHQFPLGHVLAPARRAELVTWARHVGGLVIEDDYDAEFRYDRDPVGTMQLLGPDVVALVGTVSKALAPALRLGWVAPPPAWRDRIAALKFAADGGGPALEHAAFARFLASGSYDRHLRRSRRIYRQRRDEVVAALAKHLPRARVSGIAAGLHLVVEIPGIDDRDVTERARAAGLLPMPLTATRAGTSGSPGLLIGYGAHSCDITTAAIRMLAELIG
jgi:GntR family transcriptional regulator/MocR family aminotransferase